MIEAIVTMGGKMNESYLKDMFNELERYEQSGISIKLDDHLASPMQIVAAHMAQEEKSYMRDYVWDEYGQIKELAFHNIGTN